MTKLTNGFYVGGQLTPHDLEDVQAKGIKSLIFNRPDGEGGPAQPMTSDLMAEAEALGMPALHLPMAGQLSEVLITETERAVEDLPKPILACCASGMRCAVLWAFATVQDNGVDANLKTLTTAGFPMDHLKPMLERFT